MAFEPQSENVAVIRVIADRLKEVPQGESVTLVALSQIAGRDLKKERQLIYAAIEIAMGEIGAVFGRCRNGAYTRLRSKELASVSKRARKAIRSTARKANNTIDSGVAVANDLSMEESHELYREQSALGMLEHLARDSVVKKLDVTVGRTLTRRESAQQFFDQYKKKGA